MSKAKGSEFEREISKQLSSWWTKGERDDIFWRSQNSGGRATVRKKSGKTTNNQEGDITAMDISGQPLLDLVSIELKRGYPECSIQSLIDKPNLKKPRLIDFFNQCQREINGSQRHWWLILKQNGKSKLLFFSEEFCRALRTNSFNVYSQCDYFKCKTNLWCFVVVRLDDFLQVFDSEIIKKGFK